VGPVADALTRGAWLRRWRLLAIDGFEVDAPGTPGTPGNAAEFGYAGSGEARSAFPKVRVVALAGCGTHAFVAAALEAYSVGEKTLATSLYRRLRSDELVPIDLDMVTREMTEGLRQAGRETGVNPALIEAWCELGYVVTEDNRHLFSAGDVAAWETAVRRHADNFDDEADPDGENKLDKDLR
jgi:hypothetical protein